MKNALQAKSYPVLITSAANDKLFHVQVGPFADVKEAESWKAKLINRRRHCRRLRLGRRSWSLLRGLL